jgi:hypothetical protein
MMAPKLFAHYGAGHLTLLYAISWTPWLLWAVQSGAKKDQPLQLNRLISLEAPILALIFLADPRWAVYAGLVWWGYRLFGVPRNPETQSRDSLLGRLPALLVQTVLGAFLAAPLLLPLVEFTRLSTRFAMDAHDVLAYSLPISRWLGLAIPDFGGFHEFTIYAGQIVVLLAGLAVLGGIGLRMVRFWLVVAVFSILCALGENLPPLRALASLPLVSLMRVPSRALFIGGMAYAVLAACGLQRILAVINDKEGRRHRLFFTAYAGFLFVLAGGVWALTGELSKNFTWAAVLAAVGAVWISLYLAERIAPQTWLIGLFALSLIDLGGMDRTLFTHRPAAQVLAEGNPLAVLLARREAQESFRIYSPSNSVPQQTAVSVELQLADGVDPLHLRSYADFLEMASGVPRIGYSVNQPPFAKGDPASDNRAFRPDPGLLGLLNVRYVAAEFDLDVDGLVYEGRSGTTRLYLNLFALPRAWVQADDQPIGEGARPVDLLDWSTDRISVHATGPGMLVLSEINYPGWQVWVDGNPAEISPHAGLLRYVILNEGSHEVEFVFHPISIYLGLGLGVAAWFLLAIGLFRKQRVM